MPLGIPATPLSHPLPPSSAPRRAAFTDAAVRARVHTERRRFNGITSGYPRACTIRELHPSSVHTRVCRYRDPHANHGSRPRIIRR